MEKDKKEEVQKKGIEYLIEQGYKKISTKTFISDLDLEHFLNKDFTGINKSRALGFIQILEREYNVDLSELKSAYLEYELSHRVKDPDTLFVEKPMDDGKGWQKYLQYIGILLAISVLGYMFINLINKQTITSTELIEKLEENRSVINEAQQNIKKLEENKTLSLNQEENSVTLPILVDDENGTDLDLDKVVLKMMMDRNISVTDQNSSIDLNETQDKKDNSIVETKVKPVIQVAEVVKPKVQKKKSIRGNLYIAPSKKAWVGIIYLDNYSKKDFLIRTKLPLDSSRDQLIIIGHTFFKIYNNKYSVNFTGSGPVRFIYRGGELMEISKKEFIETSAGVAW